MIQGPCHIITSAVRCYGDRYYGNKTWQRSSRKGIAGHLLDLEPGSVGNK
jgi:hypothetical protein